MDLIDDMLEDFGLRQARVLVSGAVAIVDNVKKIIILSEELITVDYGKGNVTVHGSKMWMEYISNGRMCIRGEISGIELSK